MKATDLLKKNHDTVKKMFAGFKKMGDKAPQKRFVPGRRDMRGAAHPRRGGRRDFLPGGEIYTGQTGKVRCRGALQEHKQIKSAMDDILKVEGQEPALGAKMKVLQEDVEHHADEEEKEVFKEARKLGDDRLEQLGQQIQERKKKLQSEGQKQASGKA
jgi:hypothetical protein